MVNKSNRFFFRGKLIFGQLIFYRDERWYLQDGLPRNYITGALAGEEPVQAKKFKKIKRLHRYNHRNSL